MQYDTHVRSVKEFNLDFRSIASVFLMNQGDPDIKALEIDNDKEDEYSPTEHTQVRVVDPSECLIDSV